MQSALRFLLNHTTLHMNFDQVRTMVQNYSSPCSNTTPNVVHTWELTEGSTQGVHLYSINEHNLKRVNPPKRWKLTFHKVWWIENRDNQISVLVLFLGWLSFYTYFGGGYSLSSFKKPSCLKAVKWKLQSLKPIPLQKAVGWRSCDYDKLGSKSENRFQ